MLAAELLEARQSFVEDVKRGAIAEADAFVVAEGDAGNGGDLVAGEKLVAEVHRLETHFAGVHEEVKRSLWLDDADVRDRFEASKHELESKGIYVEPIRIDEYTDKKFTFFADPDGLPIELYELTE